MSSDLKFAISIVGVLGGIICGSLIALMVTAGVINKVSFPAKQARIEQLRKDSAKAGLTASEDIMGQVTLQNQAIIENQRYNDIFLISLIIPDEWDNVKTIELPSK